jgi:hypothetical protein
LQGGGSIKIGAYWPCTALPSPTSHGFILANADEEQTLVTFEAGQFGLSLYEAA